MYLSDPPDGGYGWVVATSAFFIMGLTAARRVFLICLAPLARALSMHLSQRAVIMVGGLLAASGMIIASLGLSLPWMYLSMGVLQELGVSFSWIPANSMVSHYFKCWRSIAYAIASSGECVFAMGFSPFFIYRQLFLAGVSTHHWWSSAESVCVWCSDETPSSCTNLYPRQTGAGHKRGKQDIKKGTFQCSLIQRPELLLYIVFAILAAAGFFIPPLFLVPYANSLGMEQYWAQWAASVLSVLALADLRLVRNLQLLTMVVTAYWSILVFSSLYGFLFGCVVAIHVTSIVDIVGLEGFDSALGLFMLFRSSGGFVGPPAAGWLVDWTHDFSASFYLSGLCLVLSGVFVVLVDRLTTDHPILKADSADV
uniref:Zgc:114041 n=1 Tax=Sinocyclocheilus rhinocerous TaxID=307959 RepID=A0A673M7N1_9TELE